MSTKKVIVLLQAEKLLSLSAACSKVIDGNNIYPDLPLIISLRELEAPLHGMTTHLPSVFEPGQNKNDTQCFARKAFITFDQTKI